MARVAVIGSPGVWSSEQLRSAAAARFGGCDLLDLQTLSLDLDTFALRRAGEESPPYDAILIKKLGVEYAADQLDRLEMLRVLERRGTRFFSKPSSILRLFNRVTCTAELRAAGVPMPPTTLTADRGEAADAVRRYGRAVLKPIYSTKARGMMIVDAADADAAVERFAAAGNAFFYIQQAIPDLGRDLGVAFVGGEYLGTYARVAGAGAWNTTIHAGGKYVPYEPPQEVIDLAHKAQALFDLAFTGVDVAETPAGPVVFEVSAFGGFRGLRDALGIDAGERFAAHVAERLG